MKRTLAWSAVGAAVIVAVLIWSSPPLLFFKVLGGIALPGAIALLSALGKIKDSDGHLTSLGRVQIALSLAVVALNGAAAYIEDIQKRDAGNRLIAQLGQLADETRQTLATSSANLTATNDALRLAGRTSDAADALLEQAKRGVELATGGRSLPVFLPQVTTLLGQAGEPNSHQVQLTLTVDGPTPLRNLNVHLGRADCAARSPGDWYSRLSGRMTYQQSFETFLGRGWDPRTLAGIHPLTGTRAVFWGDGVALNGFWNFLIKLRKLDGAWCWRSVVYRSVSRTDPSRIQLLVDKFSNNFPSEMRARSPLPVSDDDCYGVAQ